MENSVETVLGPLALYLSAAEERAKVAEANYARLITGLTGLIENLPAFVNDNTPPSKGPKWVAKSGHATLAHSASSSDSDLMNSLTNEWITAGKLHKLLTARGIKIAEGTVYNRMRKLAVVRSDIVEKAANPERWRLKSPLANLLPGKVISQKSARRKKRIAATSNLGPAPDAILAVNDNSDEVRNTIPRCHQEFGVVSKCLFQNFAARSEAESFAFVDDLFEGANIVIEGENSETLHALHQQGCSVDVIYIDPPYNTGKTSFRYKDRNLDWRSFMMDRLSLAKGLLNVEGSILISIDDREHATLRVIADEVFGRRNFLGNFIWRKSPTVKNGKAGISVQHEYVVCYAKDIDKVHFNQEQTSADYIEKAYTYEDSRGRFRLAPIHKATNKSSFPVTAPNGRTWVKKWNYTATKFKALIENDMIHWGMKGTGIPAKKVYLKPQNEMTKPFGTMLPTEKVGYTCQGGNDLQALGFEKSDFLYPKPVSLIQHLLEMTTKKNSIVLDFFAGSGTTGEAVMRLNAADGGRRRFILCNSDENDICASVTYPRVTKAAEALGDNSVVQFTKTMPIFDSEVAGPARESDARQTADLLPLKSPVSIDRNIPIASPNCSTGVAAVRCGHEFIGIDIERGYLKIAKQRIEDEKGDICDVA